MYVYVIEGWYNILDYEIKIIFVVVLKGIWNKKLKF